MEKLYINIKKRREELGMTQRQLAAKCGYSDHTTIAKMEKGRIDITMGRLQQIAQALEIEPIVLTGWLDDLEDQYQDRMETYADHLRGDKP